jgi:hypothetical protein
VHFANYYLGYEIKGNEMERGVCVAEDKCIDAVGGESRRKLSTVILSRRCEDNIKLTLEYFETVRSGLE